MQLLVFDLGYAFSCGLYTHKVLCLGNNSKNQLEYPDAIEYSPQGYDQLAVGDFHVCAKSTDGSDILCWGDNEDGNLDDIPAINTTKGYTQEDDLKY